MKQVLKNYRNNVGNDVLDVLDGVPDAVWNGVQDAIWYGVRDVVWNIVQVSVWRDVYKFQKKLRR